MTMGHVGEDFEPLNWLSVGWAAMRDRAHNALTPFSDSPISTETDAADAVNKKVDTETRWGLVAADVTEFDDHIDVRIDAPGVDRKDLQVEIRGGQLRIAGEKRTQRTHKKGNALITERAFGHFFRTIPLPAEVMAEGATAGYENGVLNVSLKRNKSAGSRQVRVS